MTWYRTQTDSDLARAKADADYYRRQAEEREAEIERIRQERNHDRERARAERMRDYEDALREAGSWPEALRKNAYLLDREARPDAKLQAEAEQSDDPDFRHWAEDDRKLAQWFADSADACLRALELWGEVGARYTVEIERLRREWKAEVVERLKAERPDDGWQNTVSEIEQYDDPAELLQW
jgi:hypothetical protein